MKRKSWYSSVLAAAIAAISYSGQVQALTFPIPSQGDVVGQVQTAISKPGDTLAQIARDHDMGYTELLEANPGVNPTHIPAGTAIVIPSLFILPNAPRQGLVVNLAEMRLYYFGGGQVTTHPLGIGREGEDTPVGVLQVIQHIPSPTWTPTAEMKQLRAKEGVTLPDKVGPGPENPLGNYAMRLSNFTYLIHGTNDPLGGIGRRSSSGCMRLYPEDIETLYKQVKNGTNVYIVNEPYKAGWLDNQLYIESHVSLDDNVVQSRDDSDRIRNVVQIATRNKPAQIDWSKALEISGETMGLPQPIGHM